MLGADSSWATSMFLPGERLLKKNILLGTAPALSKQWKVSFEFKPTSYNHNGWAQIMHMTTGSKKVRAPALWIFKRKEIVIRTETEPLYLNYDKLPLVGYAKNLRDKIPDTSDEFYKNSLNII